MIIYILLFGSLIVVFSFWAWFLLASYRLKETNILGDEKLPPVSIIIAYKNAENHITQTIQAILNQDYPQFELIAINDFSTDESKILVEQMIDQRLVKLNATIDLPGKKSALTEAIDYATNDYLLFTDADCLPSSDQWIRLMALKMSASTKNEIVLGYGPMIQTETLTNVFARFETIMTAMQYFSYATFKIAYMGVGRNMMYKKSVFDRVKGYSKHQNIMSGDDDLFISQASSQDNTVVMIDKGSFMFSPSKQNIGDFFQQKSRHISTSIHYLLHHKILLGTFALSQILFYFIIMIGLIIGTFSISFCLFILVFKWSVQMLAQNKYFNLLDGINLRWYYPILDICLVLYYIFLPIFSTFSQKKW